MNKMNKKGFTIVELVIVIAVIAILAGVLIPTFGGIIDRANESAEMQKVAAAYKEAYALAMADDGKITVAKDFTTKSVIGGADCIQVDVYEFTYNESTKVWNVAKFDKTVAGENTSYKANVEYDYSYSNGAWTVEKASK